MSALDAQALGTRKAARQLEGDFGRFPRPIVVAQNRPGPGQRRVRKRKPRVELYGFLQHFSSAGCIEVPQARETFRVEAHSFRIGGLRGTQTCHHRRGRFDAEPLAQTSADSRDEVEQLR